MSHWLGHWSQWLAAAIRLDVGGRVQAIIRPNHPDDENVWYTVNR